MNAYISMSCQRNWFSVGSGPHPEGSFTCALEMTVKHAVKIAMMIVFFMGLCMKLGIGIFLAD